MLIKGVTLQDLHFGHKNTERMYAELGQFKRFIKENKVHILNINGDYFDKKLSATEPALFYAVKFFSEIVEICKEKKIKLRVLLGTRSHDLNQIATLLQHYENDAELDFKYVPTVQEEAIMGLNVLYIPEEYPEDAEAYYGQFKAKKYDIIHGHGTWDFAAFDSQIEENNRVGQRSAPVFIYDEWKDSIKDGFVIFGHIHARQNHKKKVYYSGSFTRWGYGDRSDKGFMYYEFDTDTKKYKVEHVDNLEAPGYDVAYVKDIFTTQEMQSLSMEEIQQRIDDVVSKADNIRIDLSGLTESYIDLLKGYYSKMPKVKIEVKNRSTKLKEEIEPAVYEKYKYIINREMPIAETIKRFVSEEYKQEFSIEQIKSLIEEKVD
jgi:DNA repair exonuclease SbcCD nuclease subunit